MEEREITTPVALCLPNGRLNPDAVGFTRTPLHDTSGIARGRYAWGRNKRWEYWAVVTPTHIISLTVSSIDYAAVHELFVLDRATLTPRGRVAIAPFAGSATLPGSVEGGPSRTRTKAIQTDIDEVEGGTRLRATTDGIEIDILAELPAGHERLGVVVPWNERLFQYTVKDVARPASGSIRLDGVSYPVPAGESWAVLDHGRGRWPYAMHWNWGAASGVTGGRVVGLQLGAKWTAGTGSTENAVVVDGRLHKISEELAWDYDTNDWLAPWRMHGQSADLTFTPFYDRAAVTDLGVFASRTHQCFGSYDGWIDASGERIEVQGLVGWAEDVRNRW